MDGMGLGEGVDTSSGVGSLDPPEITCNSFFAISGHAWDGTGGSKNAFSVKTFGGAQITSLPMVVKLNPAIWGGWSGGPTIAYVGGSATLKNYKAVALTTGDQYDMGHNLINYTLRITAIDTRGKSATKDCRILFSGFCGDGIVSDGLNEQCDFYNFAAVKPAPSFSNLANRYACGDLTKKDIHNPLQNLSCRWLDADNGGGYCGDGVTETAHGETCDFSGYATPSRNTSSSTNTYVCGNIANGALACKYLDKDNGGGYCGDGVIQDGNTALSGHSSFNAGEECDEGALNSNAGACSLDCVWLKRSMAAISPSTNVDGDFKADSVIFNNDALTSSLALAAGGTYLKLSGIQPTAYAYVASQADTVVVKIKVTDVTYKRECDMTTSGTRMCYWDYSQNEGDLNSYSPVIRNMSEIGSTTSRTAVNLETGDVWVHFKGTPQKVARFDDDLNLLQGPCEIDPSYTGAAGGGGGVAIDKNGNAWAGNYYTGRVVLYEAKDNVLGQPPSCNELQVVNTGQSIYGLAINADGNLFFRAGSPGRIDLPSGVVSTFPGGASYGVTVDKNGNPWFGLYNGGDTGIQTVAKNAPNGTPTTHYVPGTFAETAAVSIDAAGNLWGASPWSGGIYEFDTSGNLLLSLYPGELHHGISGTSDGYVISPKYPSPADLDIITPGATDLTTTRITKSYPSVSSFYSYADMAGLNRGMQFRSGSWTKQIDSGFDKQHWGSFTFQSTSLAPNDIIVYIGAANDQADLNANLMSVTAWNAIANWKDPARMGRYLLIKIVFKSKILGQSPVVWDFKIN